MLKDSAKWFQSAGKKKMKRKSANSATDEEDDEKDELSTHRPIGNKKAKMEQKVQHTTCQKWVTGTKNGGGTQHGLAKINVNRYWG